MHPLSNERLVNEVKKMLNIIDSKRICLAPYLNKNMIFIGEVVSITEQVSNSGSAKNAGHVTRICISDITCKGHDDVRIGHVNVFVKTNLFRNKYKNKICLGKSVQFQGVVNLYGPHRDRYGVNNPVFIGV